jgi:hypothetical protein
MKDIVVIITALAVAFTIYVAGKVSYDKGFQDGYEARANDTKKTKEILPPAEKEKPPKFAYLLNYFDDDELLTITKAAQRNDCSDDDFIILLAIRKAENGPPGLEFGIMTPYAKNTNLDKQAGAAAYEVVKYRKLWIEAGKPESFIKFMGDKYCPPSAHELNKNWIPNVTFWYEKLKPK